MARDDAPPNEEEAIFAAALGIRDPEERASYLQAACLGDESLVNRLAELLRLAEAPDSFLDGHATTQVFSTLLMGIGTLIGPYKLLQKLGEGGFGVVYMAEQGEPVRRKVALKIIKPGMDTEEVIARFEAERQALAMMDHPNIAKVYHAGATDSGYPYFVMELVHGEAITNFADSRRLSIRDRLQLFVQVCRAVQHAHQKGVIHRDIKPSNVMVTLHDGVPVTKIIDFGVAKALSQPLTARTLFTRYGTMVGTPQYMSPEQAEMSGLGVDTRSDVYSLGIILYELLTGRPPITSESLHDAGIDEIRRVIKEVEPPTPSMCVRMLPPDTAGTVAVNRSTQSEPLGKRIRGDLDRIVMKALSKDRERRYESASALADDVDRHLAGDPVLAVTPSFFYVLRKLAVKRRTLFLTAGAVAASILVGLGFFAWQFRQTLAARDLLRQELYQSEMLEAQAAWDENNFDRMIELLKRWDPAHPGNIGRDHRDIAWYFLWKLAEPTSVSQRFDLDDVGVAVACSRSARTVAITEPSRTLLLDVERNRMRDIAAHESTRFYCFADFSPDDEWLVCPHEDPSSVQLISVVNGSTHRLEQDGFVNQAAFSNDGRWLAVGHNQGATLWQRTHDEPAGWKKQRTIEPGAGVTALSFTVDSRELYLGTKDGRVLGLDVEAGDGSAVEQFSHDAFQVWAIACSADLVASAGNDVRVFDRKGRRVVQTIGGHQDEVRGVCFSPDGGTLVLSSRDGSITVWSTPAYALVGQLKGHSGIVQSLDVAAVTDGSWRLASVSQDYTMRLWEMPSAIQTRHLPTDEPVIAAVLASDATTLTYATTQPGPGTETGYPARRPLFGATAITEAKYPILSGYRIRVRDLATQADRCSVTREENFNWIALSAGSTFAVGTPDGQVRVESGARGAIAEIRFRLPPNTRHGEALAAISRDGHWLALNHGEGSITVWNVEAGRRQCTIRAPTLKQFHEMVFGDEGTTLAFVCGDDVCLHDTATGELLARIRHRHRDWVMSLAYSHAARLLAIGSFDDTASVWEIDDLPTERVVLRGHRASIQGIHLLDDARYVLTVGGDHCTKLWDARTGTMRLTLHNTNWPSTSASDGRTLATLGRRSIQFFSYATPEEVTESAWWREQLSMRNRAGSIRSRQSPTTDNIR